MNDKNDLYKICPEAEFIIQNQIIDKKLVITYLDYKGLQQRKTYAKKLHPKAGRGYRRGTFNRSTGTFRS